MDTSFSKQAGSLTAPYDGSIEALRVWLLQRALPLWLCHGLDRAGGGFHESLALDGYGCDAPFRRLRVVTRQIFVFSQGHRHGVPGADEAVALGVDFLARHAAMVEGGYAWRFDLSNRPTDATRDLYDHAFVLLALASASAVLPEAGLRSQALALMAFLDRDMAHPSLGYVEAIPPSLPRRQNPHMHLLEALLAAHDAFGDGVFLERARAIVALFLDRLLDPATGALPEYYDDAWCAERVEGVFLTEPGHHCEWAWLLHEVAVRCGADGRMAEASAGLLAFSDAHGVHARTGDLVECVSSDGAQVAQTARLWPQAERLKAAFLRPDARADGRQAAVHNLQRWLLPDGLWHERRGADGGFLPGPVPASSLYHLTCAILVASAAAPHGAPTGAH